MPPDATCPRSRADAPRIRDTRASLGVVPLTHSHSLTPGRAPLSLSLSPSASRDATPAAARARGVLSPVATAAGGSRRSALLSGGAPPPPRSSRLATLSRVCFAPLRTLSRRLLASHPSRRAPCDPDCQHDPPTRVDINHHEPAVDARLYLRLLYGSTYVTYLARAT